MRKVAIIILIALLLPSCTSTLESEEAVLDETRGQIILIQSMRNALIATENEVFSSLDALPLPPIYETYSTSLPQFRSLVEDYLMAIADTLTEATTEIVDQFFSHLDTMRIDNVAAYFERGYSSFTDELEKSLYGQVYSVYLNFLQTDDGDMETGWLALEREARIWRENLANLSLVGQGVEIDAIEAFSPEEIAAYATESFFTLLAENEILQRSRMAGSTMQ